jgi:hypothetical protein
MPFRVPSSSYCQSIIRLRSSQRYSTVTSSSLSSLLSLQRNQHGIQQQQQSRYYYNVVLPSLSSQSSRISNRSSIENKEHFRTTTNTDRFFSSTKKTTEITEIPKKLGIPYNQLSIGIPKEIYEKECRVAITPESVQRLITAKFKNIYIEENAGVLSKFNNTTYEKMGATIVSNVWKQSDIILKVIYIDISMKILVFHSSFFLVTYFLDLLFLSFFLPSPPFILMFPP